MTIPIFKVLAPIKAPAEVLHGARYASRLMDKGRQVTVCMLYVAKRMGSQTTNTTAPVMGHSEAVEENARALLNEATALLVAHGIPHSSIVRWGDVAFTILDVAEELQCNEILLPPRRPRFWPRLFSKGIAERLVAAQRNVPLVTSDWSPH